MYILSKVTNVHSGQEYFISSAKRPIKNVLIEEYNEKVNIVYESRISLHKAGELTLKRKNIVVYVNYCTNATNKNITPATIDVFHLGIGNIIKNLEDVSADEVVHTLHGIELKKQNDYFSIALSNKELGSFIFPKEIHIFNFKPYLLPENSELTAKDVFEVMPDGSTILSGSRMQKSKTWNSNK